MRYITNWYINKYKNSVVFSLGWTKDDLLQNIRIAMWKGIATFDASKNFKIETYLSAILDKYFASLAKRCSSARKNDILHNSLIDEETRWIKHAYLNKPAEIAPDEHAYRADSIARFFGRLTRIEKIVLQKHIVQEMNIPTVALKLKMSREEVTVIVKSLRVELRHHMRREEDDGDNI